MNIEYMIATSKVPHFPVLLITNRPIERPGSNSKFESNLLYLPTYDFHAAEPILHGVIEPEGINYGPIARNLSQTLKESHQGKLPSSISVCVESRSLYSKWRDFAKSLCDFPFEELVKY